MLKEPVWIPEDLNLVDLIEQNPYDFKPFKIDTLVYFVSLVTLSPFIDKKYAYDLGIPLHSTILKKFSRNYKDYFRYMEEELCIIEVDHSYHSGSFSKKYRLVKKYRGKVKSVNINDYTLVSNVQKFKQKNLKTTIYYKHLTKWYNLLLQIDHIGAHGYNIKRYADGSIHAGYDKEGNFYMHPATTYAYNAMSIENLKNGNYNLTVDNKGGRFHSNLTNLKSELRNFITYNGQRLISIDLKNSQPYLSIILMRQDFWDEEKQLVSYQLSESLKFQHLFYPAHKAPSDSSYFYSNSPYIYNSSLHSSSKVLPFIMLGKIHITLANKGFDEFVEIVTEGRFYEFIEDKFKQEFGVTFDSRKEIKKVVFQVLFTANQFIGQKDARYKKHFKQLFPEVYELFSVLKSKKKEILPILLQRIESFMFLDVITRRIAEELPEAPIFTIHDSIATTEKYIDEVERIMREELTKAVGYPPTLQREVWEPKNVDVSQKVSDRSKVA